MEMVINGGSVSQDAAKELAGMVKDVFAAATKAMEDKADKAQDDDVNKMTDAAKEALDDDRTINEMFIEILANLNTLSKHLDKVIEHAAATLDAGGLAALATAQCDVAGKAIETFKVKAGIDALKRATEGDGNGR